MKGLPGLLLALVGCVSARDWTAADYARKTIYHSPQTPGFTCWVGAWRMPDGSVMASCTQATGPVEGRAKAPKEIIDRLSPR